MISEKYIGGDMLERTEGWVHAAVELAPLKALGSHVIEGRVWRDFLHSSHPNTYTRMCHRVWCGKKSADWEELGDVGILSNFLSNSLTSGRSSSSSCK